MKPATDKARVAVQFWQVPASTQGRLPPRRRHSELGHCMGQSVLGSVVEAQMMAKKAVQRDGHKGATSSALTLGTLEGSGPRKGNGQGVPFAGVRPIGSMEVSAGLGTDTELGSLYKRTFRKVWSGYQCEWKCCP